MNRKSYFSLLAFAATLLAAVVFVVGYNERTRAAAPAGALASLPASDFVLSVDVQRALNDTLPAVLASNPAALAKMNAKLEEFQRKTGVNPRVFDSVAVGGSFDPQRPGKDSRAVVIAQGSFKSDELLETAFASAKAQEPRLQREEQQYEGRRIFLLYSTRTQADDARDGKTVAEAEARAKWRGRSEKMAVTALDANTIAIGELDGVRAAIDASLGRNRVDEELVRMATETPGAIVGFGGRVPQNAAGKPANGFIEKYFASIRQFYGSFGADGADARASLNLRTETAEQANELGQALNGFKALSAFGFSRSGGGAGPEDSLADLLKGLSINTLGNEVQISVRVPQTTFAPLIKSF
jgi:hypothetical protein